MLSTPYQKYQQSSVQTAPPGQLVLMLYDGAIRFVKIGMEAIGTKEIQKSNESLIKAQRILHELIASLNFQYPISNDLLRIYEYLISKLIEANTRKNKQCAAEVIEHLAGLREAWLQAMKPTSSHKVES